MNPKSTFNVTHKHLRNLPEPVQRYMNFTGVLGKPWIHAVRLKQTGRFRTADDRPWMPMQAVQTYTTDPPSFRWDARFRLFGLPLLRAEDQYISGHGRMFGKLAGVFTLFNSRGEELDQGAMLRYLSEAIWFPVAFLGKNIHWETVDNDCAQVTLTDAGTSVSGKLYIDADGKPINFSAMRYREVRGDYSLDAWSTPITEYGERSGLILPTHGQAMWHLDSGPFTYVELRIGPVEYNVDIR
jgi:hypothetical protein